MKSERLAAGVPVCHPFVSLRELHLLFGPQNAFPLTHSSRNGEEVPFSFRTCSLGSESHSPPLCYLPGIVLEQDLYSDIFILRKYSSEGKEFYWRLFNTLKLCC